jgi:guanosine-3',5'-bis(diphosphate) 3'-pyrophosphohydrolase
MPIPRHVLENAVRGANHIGWQSGAVEFAWAAHAGQVRRYTGEPYVCHPITVAYMVEQEGGSGTEIIAALLHDVVEDTPVTLHEVARTFGDNVGDLVGWLTDISFGNRAERNAQNVAKWARAPLGAVTVKLADLIDNTRSIARHDPKFARVYIPEKRAILEAMAPTCVRSKVAASLSRLAWKTIEDAEEAMGLLGPEAINEETAR